MGVIIPPLEVKILLESNPLKSRISVRRLAAPENVIVAFHAVSVSAHRRFFSTHTHTHTHIA